jgi:choline dehydrogenase-like flavoprotein
MGGLRMGTDARVSVVDCDLKVHGIDNLHVASCAVFPAGGSSNPTFTMMALTLRLVDRLAALLAGGR